MEIDVYKVIQTLPYYEFERLVYELIKSVYGNENVETFNRNQDYGFDFLINHNKKRIFVQVKISKNLSIDKIRFLTGFENFINRQLGEEILLVTNSTLTNAAKDFALQQNIQVWDINTIVNYINSGYIKNFILFDGKTEGEINIKIVENKNDKKNQTIDEFILKIQNLQTGTNNALQYQKLISDILEFLFSPPLELPKYEITDFEGRNRRDIIFENSTDNLFWKGIRDNYSGHYIVVDAKNYGNPISKKPIIETAHYLKPYGCGMFAIVVCRKGTSGAAEHAIKEQWIGNRKMIIVISDEELIEMLNIKRKSGFVEEIIREKIANFRMKL